MALQAVAGGMAGAAAATVTGKAAPASKPSAVPPKGGAAVAAPGAAIMGTAGVASASPADAPAQAGRAGAAPPRKADLALADDGSPAAKVDAAPDDGAGFRLPPPGTAGLPPLAAPVAGTTPQAQAAVVSLAQFAGAVAARARTGTSDFDIRLDPPDLGSVNVHLTIGADGRVDAHFTVERADTLNLLQGDVGRLQSTLQQAGFKSDPATTSFQLQGGGGQQSAWQQPPQQQQRPAVPPPLSPPPRPLVSAAPAQPAYRPPGRAAGGLDILI